MESSLTWKPWCAFVGWKRLLRRLLLRSGWQRALAWTGRVRLAPPPDDRSEPEGEPDVDEPTWDFAD